MSSGEREQEREGCVQINEQEHSRAQSSTAEGTLPTVNGQQRAARRGQSVRISGTCSPSVSAGHLRPFTGTTNPRVHRTPLLGHSLGTGTSRETAPAPPAYAPVRFVYSEAPPPLRSPALPTPPGNAVMLVMHIHEAHVERPPGPTPAFPLQARD